MMQIQKFHIRAALLLGFLVFALSSTFITARYVIGKQLTSQLVLTAIDATAETIDPTTTLISIPGNDGVYLANRSSRKMERLGAPTQENAERLGVPTDLPIAAIRQQPYVPGLLYVGFTGYVARVEDDGEILTQNPQGELLGRFSVNEITSLAVMSNGNVVVAGPSDEKMLHIYKPTGELIAAFGNVAKRLSQNLSGNHCYKLHRSV